MAAKQGFQWEVMNGFYWALGSTITGRFLRQGKIRLIIEVEESEGIVAYRRSRFKGGSDLISPSWYQGDLGQAYVRGEPII